jgi:hypothetical protein
MEVRGWTFQETGKMVDFSEKCAVQREAEGARGFRTRLSGSLERGRLRPLRQTQYRSGLAQVTASVQLGFGETTKLKEAATRCERGCSTLAVGEDGWILDRLAGLAKVI